MPGIVLTAFGVTAPNGEAPLLAFEREVRLSFPSCRLRWAFTARQADKRPSIRDEPGLGVHEALSRFAAEHIAPIIVQPLHVTDGHEQETLRHLIADWQKEHSGVPVFLGEPLLSDEDSLQAALDAMRRVESAVRRPGETALWVGHGSDPPRNETCRRLAFLGHTMRPPVHVAYLIDEQPAEAHFAALAGKGVTEVCLIPFFALAGRHTLHDLDGDAAASWKSRCIAAGMPCRVHMRGMLEDAAFSALWLARLRDTLACAHER